MMLKPFFTGEVPDIIVVPINISYDRVLEEKLFTFELLGVPKPKETTSVRYIKYIITNSSLIIKKKKIIIKNYTRIRLLVTKFEI